MKILVVEDIKFSSLLLENYLKSLGHKVFCVSSGFEALDLLQSGQDVDAVICDLYLPDMDGFRVYQDCQQLKRYRKGLAAPPPFILLTSSKNTKDLLEAESLGFVGALTKPFNMQLLKELLEVIDDGNAYIKHESGRTRILVVDSNGKNHDLLQDIFSGTGYTLIFANSGSQCLEYLFEYKGIKMVICDLELSDTNAIALLKNAREAEDLMNDKLLPPFVLMSSSKDMDLLQIAHMSGFVEIITEPFEKFAIKQKLNKVFSQDAGTHPNHKSILIVDDIGFHCMLTKTILLQCRELRDLRYNIILAHSGFEALEILKTDPTIDLVITDLYMPDLDGVGLYREYHSFLSKSSRFSSTEFKPPGFLLLTIASDDSALAGARSVGFQEVFNKPVDPHALLPAVSSVLGLGTLSPPRNAYLSEPK